MAGKAVIVTRRGRQEVDRAVQEAEELTGLQFCVYLGPANEDTRAHAESLFEQAGLNARPGVLLLVAPRDRAVRIEVGYGLEPILPDGLAGEIIRTAILPEFRAGNIPRGIGRGLDRIARVIRRDPAAVPSTVSRAGHDDRPSALVTVPFFASFVLLAAFVTGLAIRTKTRGPLLWSGLFAGIPLILAEVFMYRHHPQTRRVAELVREGAVGELRAERFAPRRNVDPEGRVVRRYVGLRHGPDEIRRRTLDEARRSKRPRLLRGRSVADHLDGVVYRGAVPVPGMAARRSGSAARCGTNPPRPT